MSDLSTPEHAIRLNFADRMVYFSRREPLALEAHVIPVPFGVLKTLLAQILAAEAAQEEALAQGLIKPT